MSSHPREWNSGQYHQLSDPQFQFGLKVLDRLDLRGDETVLDAGCGTGRVTAELARRLPNGRVIASDVSENMLGGARETLAPFGDRIRFVHADMTDLPLETEVDAVFSTAAFHWVKDHDVLFRSLHRVLKPNGRIVAQCGGGPNVEMIRARTTRVLEERSAYAACFRDFQEPWYYASPEQTTGRLKRIGFVDAEAWLQSAPTVISDPPRYREFLRTILLRAHIAKLPPDGQDYLLDRMTELAAHDDPPFMIDYWRLNIDAKKD